MGQRGARAAFMPEMFVFPGGAVDDDDLALGGETRARRRDGAAAGDRDAAGAGPGAGAGGGARALGGDRPRARAPGLRGGGARAVPAGWRAFHDRGFVPRTEALRFVFRAITPPGRPRRFDARFFLADAEALAPGGDDFAGAGGELAHLQWLDIAAARALPLPFITEVVLSEVEALLAAPGVARGGAVLSPERGRRAVQPAVRRPSAVAGLTAERKAIEGRLGFPGPEAARAGVCG